jgi:hypothetical protein
VIAPSVFLPECRSGRVARLCQRRSRLRRAPERQAAFELDAALCQMAKQQGIVEAESKRDQMNARHSTVCCVSLAAGWQAIDHGVLSPPNDAIGSCQQKS